MTDRPRHNHFTRDIKPPGQCPACDPPAPENVRIEFADGTIVPCELTYLGVEDGLHVWEAVNVAAVPPAVSERRAPVTAQVHMDTLPGRTTIRLRIVVVP